MPWMTGDQLWEMCKWQQSLELSEPFSSSPYGLPCPILTEEAPCPYKKPSHLLAIAVALTLQPTEPCSTPTKPWPLLSPRSCLIPKLHLIQAP